MALDQTALDTPGSPEWFMQYLARQLLDRNRVRRLATLEAYRAGCPPLPYLAPSERKGFYAFHRVSRTNVARSIISAPANRMAVRSIRTAAAGDDNGDQVAWRYWTANGLDIAAKDVHSDFLTFTDAYVHTGLRADGRPVAVRCDPRFTITAQDPLDEHRTIAGFQLLWDEVAGRDYAYLWLPGQQWVAERPRTGRPPSLGLPGISTADARRFGWWWPRLSFDPRSFTMRPVRPGSDDPDAEDFADDGGPYSETFTDGLMPLVRFHNRDGVGEFEEHLDLLDRINHTIMQRVVIAAVQAYKQRALRQDGTDGVDRLPDTDPRTGKDIDWDALFEPGPDALWKLPPGVSIWESTETQLQPILSAVQDDMKHLSAVTDTPLPLLSDDTNSSAEAAQLRREGLVFKVEDRDTIAARGWSQVIASLFAQAPDEDRYADPQTKTGDRADAGQIIIDWAPAERFSLAEKSSADSLNKSLSVDMAAAKIWGLTPDEVQINRAQRAADLLLNPPPAPAVPSGTAA